MEKIYEKFHIVFVLDRSGSMQSVRESTINGFNEFLTGQKNAPGMAKVTLIQFDNAIETVYEGLGVEGTPHLTWNTFQPRGGTALYDAIGYAIEKTDAAMSWATDVKPLVVILTDGQENQSRKFSRSSIFELISSRRAMGWDFVFIGANQDAFSVGTSLGVAGGYTYTYDANPIGTANTFSTLSSSTVAYRGVGGQSLNFFAPETTTSNSVTTHVDANTETPKKAKRPTKKQK